MHDLALRDRRETALFYQNQTGHPEQKLRLVAVTGTNGKTTVSTLLQTILTENGERVGLIGTVECFDGKIYSPSEYTTPPPHILYPLLARMVKNGVTTVIMEASSHALSQERLYGLHFALAIFTNLTRDHLDYHGTREAYLAAKAKLFESASIALLNADDDAAAELAFHASGKVYYYAKHRSAAEFSIENAHCEEDSLSYTLQTMDGSLSIHANLIGRFNVYNTAAALSAASLLGVSHERLERAAKKLSAPRGRMERLPDTDDLRIFIDYAHTPDALSGALMALKPHTKKLTALFGAGGERDKGKRADMGRIAETIADRVIVTSDNPREEKPEAILRDILSGMKNEKHKVLADRAEAIRHAILTAESGETILLAGKGHEAYMLDGSGKHDFSEREIVEKAILKRKKHHKKGM